MEFMEDEDNFYVLRILQFTLTFKNTIKTCMEFEGMWFVFYCFQV